MNTSVLWHNGQIKPWKEATVHVSTHALHYGSSVFEGERVYETPTGPAYFRLNDHTQRLFESARVYDIPIPYSQAQINDACMAVIRANGMSCAYVRPIVFRGAGTLNLTPCTDTPVEVAIIAIAWGPYLGEAAERGADVRITSWQRPAANTLPGWVKAGGHYLNNQLIAMEARRDGYDEGIALNPHGLLSEGSGENLFLVKQGRLLTPPGSASILSGITRASVMTLASELGLDVEERDLPREALYNADEVFMTGTAAEITPVRSVDRKPVGQGVPGPITCRLRKTFFGLFDGTTPDRWHWLSSIGATSIPDKEQENPGTGNPTPHAPMTA